MRKIIFETERLIATTFQASDIEFLWKEYFADWEVMKLLIGRTFTLEETRDYIQKAFSTGQLMDFIVVYTKENSEFIGYAGMFSYSFNNRNNELIDGRYK